MRLPLRNTSLDSLKPTLPRDGERRRWADEGMRNASRYLATVRRAISTPDKRNRRAMASSDSAAPPVSEAIIALMRWRTASDECGLAPSAPFSAALKKYFIGKVPRSDPIALLAVTREIVDSCIPIASAIDRRFIGRR